jgi:hypothetical protein
MLIAGIGLVLAIMAVRSGQKLVNGYPRIDNALTGGAAQK